jgi:two-component system, NarL family, nitrate/nitrite response regulator NarL
MSVIPAIVTHPCTLFRDGLGQILAATRFRPVHLAADLDEAAISHLSSAETCLWLHGLEKCNESTFDLVRRVCTTAPGVKAIILARFQTAEDVWPALEAGASGFLCQDISCERLIKSLELIALGGIIVPAEFLHAVGSRMTKLAQPAACTEHSKQVATVNLASSEMTNGNGASIDNKSVLIRRLSKRETSILRLLMHGASNKVIARQLVITEATVKVHIKAILRKLTLHNRTQAALWACNHLDGNGDSEHMLVPAIAHLEEPPSLAQLAIPQASLPMRS